MTILRFFALFFCIGCLIGCDNTDAKKNVVTAPVHVEKAALANITRELQAVGNVRASASVGLIPRVAGEIKAVNFTEGQTVKAEQPLILIDPRPYETALKEKQAMLAKSEAQLAKALDDRRRFGKLVSNGYVSREAYQQTATDAAALAATVQADRAAVENAALDLEYCTLKAPISGRIGELKVHKGNMVKSGSTEPIANIDALEPCYVTFSVPEMHLSAILAQMEQGPVPVIATPAGGSPEQGELMLIDNNVDEKTGTIKLRAVFDNKNQHLWPGQFVNISLTMGELENALLIPANAIQPGRDSAYIYIVNKDGIAEFKPIKPYFEANGKTAVEADLQPGDLVVVEGQVRLTPGMPVKILN